MDAGDIDMDMDMDIGPVLRIYMFISSSMEEEAGDNKTLRDSTGPGDSRFLGS